MGAVIRLTGKLLVNLLVN